METFEIPKPEWAGYLSALSNRRADCPVRVRIEAPDLGDQAMAEGLPLVGISVEGKGAMAEAIALTVADAGGDHNLTHHVLAPIHVYVGEDEHGEVKVLDIEDGEHVKTLIFFEERLSGA